MANLKITIDDFEEDAYHIIAVHTSLEDYRLAYFLNLNLELFLSKNQNDVESQDKVGKANFTRFTFEDKTNFINWNLVQNKNEIEVNTIIFNNDLFSQSNNRFSTISYLLPEQKKVDYFLKIENAAEIDLDEIVSKINKIDSINMVYAIPFENIKSKNNLIF